MPEEIESEVIKTAPFQSEENSQELSLLFQKVLSPGGGSSNFTEKQVDEVLSQKREITSFIHTDRKQESYDSKFYLVVILIFITLFSGLVLVLKPDLFGETLSFLVGAFGGGLGGYGIGKNKK